MIKIGKKTQVFIDILQWILILGLAIYSYYLYSYYCNNNFKRDLETIKTENSYLRIHSSRKIKELEIENKELYDSIKYLSNIKSAVQIKYRYHFRTDTIKVTEFVKGTDSVYRYSSSNDTIQTNISVKAKELDWVKVEADINEKFMLISKLHGDRYETYLKHSNNVDVLEMTAFEKKRSFKERIFYGPSLGVGYNPINNNVGLYVGISIGYDLKK